MYEPFIISGRLIALSAISSAHDGRLVTGKVGRELDLASGQQAARNAAENLLAVLLHAVGGDPASVEQILFVRGYVNAGEDFPAVHQVMDAASKIIIYCFGDRGRHARSAIGCATLPNNNAVTIELMAVIAIPS